MLAHGSRGSVKGYSAEQIAERLTSQQHGLRPEAKNVTLMFMSCYAGANRKAVGPGGQAEEPDSSVVAQLSKALAQRNRTDITVIGGTGPTVKSNPLGDHFYVIRNPDLTTGVKDHLNTNPELSEATLTERYRTWVQQETTAGRPPTIEAKAHQVVEIYRARMFAFRDELRGAGALYDDSRQADRDASVRMFIGGQEIANPNEKDQILQRILTTRAL